MVTVDFDRLAVKPGFKILDIGCGSGRHTGAAYRCQNVTVIGVDLNFKELIEADDRLKLHDRLGAHGGGAWGLSAADLTCLPFKDDYFDIVICCEVLEHLDDPDRGLAEVARVARRHVLVSTPWEPVWRALNIARGRYLRALGNTPGHVQHFSRRDLERLASRHLKLLQQRTPLPWTIILGEKVR